MGARSLAAGDGGAARRAVIGLGMAYEYVCLCDEKDFAVLTMRRPERRNALSEAHLRELRDALRAVAESPARGLVLAAEGPVFCAGHDFADMEGRDLEAMR